MIWLFMIGKSVTLRTFNTITTWTLSFPFSRPHTEISSEASVPHFFLRVSPKYHASSSTSPLNSDSSFPKKNVKYYLTQFMGKQDCNVAIYLRQFISKTGCYASTKILNKFNLNTSRKTRVPSYANFMLWMIFFSYLLNSVIDYISIAYGKIKNF